MDDNSVISLWPGVAPGTEDLDITETVEDFSTDPKNPKRRISKVTCPSLTSFIPEKPNGIAVLIIPGGGWRRLVIDTEGVEIARWLTQLGITAFVLKHRLPVDAHADWKYASLQDAQRAMRIIRKNACLWKLDLDKIGVMGFSAGGHLASVLGTNFRKQVYQPIDTIDLQSARPDFMVLAYSYISTGARLAPADVRQDKMPPWMTQEFFDEFPTDRQITTDTPPTFIVAADNDGTVSPENSIRFYLGLRKCGIPAEIHIFTHGGHGFGVNKGEGPIMGWTELYKKWMLEIGII